MASSPQAIWSLWADIVAKWKGAGQQDEELSGIVGDALHSFGFHLSPNDLRARGEGNDYSLQGARNQAGAKAHPDEASALDVHFDPAGMIVATKRLVAAAKANDPRMRGVFELCGTTNGYSPHAYYLATRQDDPNNTGGWDDGHVTHIHLSFWRDVCDDYAAIAGVADVIAGIRKDWFDAMSAAEKAAFAKQVAKQVLDTEIDTPTDDAPKRTTSVRELIRNASRYSYEAADNTRKAKP